VSEDTSGTVLVDTSGTVLVDTSGTVLVDTSGTVLVDTSGTAPVIRPLIVSEQIKILIVDISSFFYLQRYSRIYVIF
jgi:hypothetical protein